MSNITVLRVEDADGHGPFHGSETSPPTRELANHVSWLEWREVFFFAGLASKPEDGDRHPTHVEDCLGGRDVPVYKGTSVIDGDWVVGCKDEAQLLYWFEGSGLSYLTTAGYSINVYSVPSEDVIEGEWQLMFKKDSATLLRSVPASEIASVPAMEQAA